VGIGTSSPGVPLDIQCNTNALGVNLRGRSDGISLQTFYSNNNATKYGHFWVSPTDFEIRFLQSGPLKFYTADTERARIDSSGNLLVGTTSAIRSGLNIVNSAPGQITFRHNSQAAGRYYYMGVESGNDVFFIYPDIAGGVYLTRGATSWTGNSDERLKTDLAPIENAAAKVSSLRAVTGRFTTDEENVSRAFLIAQDVQAVLPQAVDVRDDEQGTLGLRYTDTIPLLVAAIKEQQQMIETLQAKVAALEAK
jgi:hypothetical protein